MKFRSQYVLIVCKFIYSCSCPGQIICKDVYLVSTSDQGNSYPLCSCRRQSNTFLFMGLCILLVLPGCWLYTLAIHSTKTYLSSSRWKYKEYLGHSSSTDSADSEVQVYCAKCGREWWNDRQALSETNLFRKITCLFSWGDTYILLYM